ncbi:MAG: DUF2179 domain-containing protein [Chloroflexi bacterium]|nr:DUF2179 domain-containing protein [Chloroflexota bacterium]
MPDISLLPPLAAALLIFGLRVIDMSLDTLRFLFVVRGRKAVAWVLGFFQAAVFVLAITSVLSNLKNPWNLVGYAAGFATGVVVGMWIEERLAIGHTHLRIISSWRGPELSARLRDLGHAVTEIPARGKDGTVSLLNCSVLRKDVERVQQLVKEVDPQAFITAQDLRPLWRGFWRA